MKVRLSLVAALAVLVALLTGPMLSAQPPTQPLQGPNLPFGSPTSDFGAIRAQAAQQGTVRVIVQLNTNEAFTSPNANVPDFARTTAIRGAQGLLTASLAGGNVSSVKMFDYVPLMGLQVDAAALDQLRNSPYVASITLDVPQPPLMNNSTTQIGVKGAGGVWEMGITGKGVAVAVLDTGVARNHPALAGQVVSEACYSTTDSYWGSKSACPNGQWGSTAVGSGKPCDAAVVGCDHGTHVAGTVASTDTTYTGVAPDAKIIAIQVFSEFPVAVCGYRCALTYTTDQIAGLERVYALRHTYNIASVNMSLGGDRAYGSCDGDTRKPIIDLLRNVNIATVIASGNNGWTDSVSYPGCISSAITVGAVDDSNVIASFSNQAGIVDMMAPGVGIISSVPGGSFESFNGTSMATPHVAGAWALMRQAFPVMTVSQVESYLEANGLSISDTRIGGTVSKPRITVNNAINAAPSMTWLANGGMEIDAVKNNIPDAWTIKNRTKDRIKCDTDLKTFAYSGDCAFQFKGSTYENAMLSQNANLAADTLTSGDILTLSAWVDGVSSVSNLKLKLRVIYSDGTPKGKSTITVNQTSGYQFFSGDVSIASSQVQRVKVILQNRSKSGRVLVDDVSLDKNVALQSAPNTVPLPEAPAGFRN